MKQKEVVEIVQYIVDRAVALKNKYTDEKILKVDYVAIFAQSEEEYQTLVLWADQIGEVLQSSNQEPLYKIKPVQTSAGELFLLKIRRVGKQGEKRGYADFRVDYAAFKKRYLGKPNFKRVERPTFEMIELREENNDVLVYFPYTPLSRDLGFG